MEEINHYKINWQVTALVFARDLEQFLLSLIAQLALPEAQTVFGHHGDLETKISDVRIEVFIQRLTVPVTRAYDSTICAGVLPATTQ